MPEPVLYTIVMSASRSRTVAYSLAVLLSLIVSALMQFVEPVRTHLPFLSLVVVVILSAWYGGLGPGLLAAALTAVAGAYFVLPLENSFALSVDNLIRLAMFLLAALLISSLSGASKQAQAQSERLLERERAARADAEEAERRSEESAALLDALMASSPVGLALIDREFRYVRLNDALAAINDASREDHLGRKVDEIVPDLAPKAEALYRQVLETGKPVIGEVVSGEIPSLPGEQRHRLVNYFPVSVQGKEVSGLGIAVVDITDRKRTEEALRASQERLAGLINSAMDAIISIDATQRIILFNAAAERIFRCSASEALGSPIDRFIPERLRSVHAEHVRMFGETGVTSRSMSTLGTLTGLRSDGEEFPIEATISQIGEADQKLYTVILRDITERVRADAARERDALHMQALAEASRLFAEAGPDLQTVLDTVTRQVGEAVGDACILHLASEDRLSLPAVSVYHREPESLDLLRKATASPHTTEKGVGGRILQSGQPLTIPELSRDMAMSIVQQSLRQHLERNSGAGLIVVPLRVSGNTIGVLAALRDKPGRPYTVEDQRLLQDIADRAALAIDNAHLLHETQEEMRRREEFLSIASHELKTPLTTVKGYVQLLSRELKRPDADLGATAEFLGDLNDQVLRFEALVADLLDASRIQRDKLELRIEPVDLTELARKVLNRFAQSTERQDNHVLTLDAPESVNGSWDIDRLDQVLTNLISNAIKYSPDGGEVRLGVRRVDDEAEITVIDNGIGISQAEQADLFRPFIRGAAAHSIAGTGLGLYITGQIVERHGGSIHIESEPGKGSAFIVRLPLDATDVKRET